MTKAWSFAGVLMLSAVAAAQPLTGEVRWEASNDGGASWHTYLAHTPGQPYKVRALASWTDGATASVGLAAAAFEQIDLVGAGTGDSFDIGSAFKRQPPPHTEWTVQPGTAGSVGFLKIDDVTPSRRLYFGQLPKVLPGSMPNPDFDGSNPLLVFEMDAVAAPDPAGRIITIAGQWFREGTPEANYFRIYLLARGDNKRPLQEATQIPVTIDTINPAPGSAVMLGLAGCATVARRRR